MGAVEVAVTSVKAAAFVIPTDLPEADGTFSWNKTTLVIVEIAAGNIVGLGYTYADALVGRLINDTLAEHVIGRNAVDVVGICKTLWGAVRNLGRSGLAACAISAVDLALWDLKARHLQVNLGTLLGQLRDSVVIYGSGGFTSYNDAQLTRQLSDWVQGDGCSAVKMKIGSEPDRDPARIGIAKRAIGEAALFVDANGAFTARQAIAMMPMLSNSDVRWFEEPVSSDDREGMGFVRAHAVAPLDIAAGEYNYTLDDVRLLLEAAAVDVLQCDVTRCGGISGFLRAAALCEAFHIPLSGHCAPSAHLHVACASPMLRHLEWFHDHVRIEQMLFDGAPMAKEGSIWPDLSQPGNGLSFKHRDAEKYAL